MYSKEFKLSIKEKLQMIYLENVSKIRNIKALELTITNAVTDLTNEDMEENNTQQAISTGSPKAPVDEKNFTTPPSKGSGENKYNINQYFK